ncbi:hypothetical protein N9N28_07485 [Rubripirellula amarantea]|nr:hypothetical protein [Rubripirellula amarantea]
MIARLFRFNTAKERTLPMICLGGPADELVLLSQRHPWARWNLVRNPFGELTRGQRASLAVLDEWDSLESFTRQRHAVQFIGDCGRGKSTRLISLQSRLPESVYVYLAEDAPVPALPVAAPLIIDEAQRLNRAAMKCVFNSGVPLILGTHKDLSRRLRKHGYNVVTYAIGEQNTPSLIRRVLNRRIEDARFGEGEIPFISEADAEQLSRRFGTDIRAIEGYLYETWQRKIANFGATHPQPKEKTQAT